MIESLKKYNKEFVTIDGVLHLIDINFIPFQDFDINTIKIIKNKLDDDPNALRGLELLKVPNLERVHKYGKCNFGAFDSEADVTKDGSTTVEYVPCSERGKCPAEGLLCKCLAVENGHLTPTEIQYIKLCAADLPDKQIADIMNISEHTARKHRQNITEKLGSEAHSKNGITAFAYRKNLLSE